MMAVRGFKIEDEEVKMKNIAKYISFSKAHISDRKFSSSCKFSSSHKFSSSLSTLGNVQIQKRELS